jgi:hypothetical protein
VLLGGLLLLAIPLFKVTDSGAEEAATITFNKNFEGGALGKVEHQGEAHFRCHVEGQQDERGRNRLANWYYFRMDGVEEREITLTLTDLIGEYNDRPGTCAFSADTIPVFSEDGEHWQHFPAMEWDDQKKEATLHFRPRQESLWIAHVPPYVPRRLARLLEEVQRCPAALIEVIGKSVRGRDLHLVTVTNPDIPDARKKVVWLIARQHAWEAGTSFVLEGALRFLISDDAQAKALRDRVVFRFVPMMDPDGCAAGGERFNANGYDVNRHWDEVDLRRKVFLEHMPEIWYVKKAILNSVDGGRSMDLLLNLHNTESNEYLETQAGPGPAQTLMQRLFERLTAATSFDPSAERLRTSSQPAGTTNSLFTERGIPVVLMEQRIGFSKKLSRRPTVQDRLDFGKQLSLVLAEVVSRPADFP